MSFFITGCDKKESYSISECAYCGATWHLEGESSTISSPRFPSANPPEHMHLFFLMASYNSKSKMYVDCTSDACNILWQLIELNSQDQLSEAIIEEWFSINVGNPEILEAFASKHKLKLNTKD